MMMVFSRFLPVCYQIKYGSDGNDADDATMIITGIGRWICLGISNSSMQGVAHWGKTIKPGKCKQTADI